MGDEGFEFEAVPFLESVLFEIEEVYYLGTVLGDESAGVADVVTLVKSVANATLTVAVLLVESCGHVAAVDEVAAVCFVEVVYAAAGDTADVSMLVGIAQADVTREYFIEFANQCFLTSLSHAFV